MKAEKEMARFIGLHKDKAIKFNLLDKCFKEISNLVIQFKYSKQTKGIDTDKHKR